MDIEENIRLFQQYQKSNKLEKASEIADEIAKEDRKSTRLNSSHTDSSRMPSSA